jgi:hypothetical protein
MDSWSEWTRATSASSNGSLRCGPRAVAATFIEELMRGFEQFRGEVPVGDDLTLVALKLPSTGRTRQN